MATDSSTRVSGEELALRLGVPPDRVERLADGAAIGRDADGRFDLGDVHRLRLLLAFEAAGVPLEALVEASRSGTISLRYYDQLHPTPGLPSGHAGLASGPLIARDGDVFGRTVNLAARIADVTPDGHLYIPEAVAASLPNDRFDVRPAEGAVLQGIGRVALMDVVRAG